MLEAKRRDERGDGGAIEKHRVAREEEPGRLVTAGVTDVTGVANVADVAGVMVGEHRVAREQEPVAYAPSQARSVSAYMSE